MNISDITHEGIYEGEYKNSVRHGKGKLTYKGTVYTGQFVNDKLTGKGTIESSIESYSGDIVNFQKHGKGVVKYVTGSVYEGDFVNGKKTGFGKMTYSDGTVKQGLFEDDKFIKPLTNAPAQSVLAEKTTKGKEKDTGKDTDKEKEANERRNKKELLNRRESIEEHFPHQQIKELGSGAFGTVYRVTKNGSNVAVKISNRTHVNLREYSILKKLKCSHKNVLCLLDEYDDENYIYLIMTYIIDSLPLSEVKIPNNLMKSFFYQLASGLNYIHSKDVLHLDLKPENILVTKDYMPVIIDFGLSCLLNPESSLSTSGSIAGAKDISEDICYNITSPRGTLYYIAPEMLNNGLLTPATDTYSLGCIFYYVFTGGKLPYKSTNVKDFVAEKRKPIDHSLFPPAMISEFPIIIDMLEFKAIDRPPLDQVMADLR